MGDLISVIVIDEDCSLFRERCLNSIKRQTYTETEIMVVIGAGSRFVAEACRKARGEYVFFCSSTSILQENTIEELYRETLLAEGNVLMCADIYIRDGGVDYHRCTEDTALYGKLFRKKILSEIEMAADEGDVFWRWELLVKYMTGAEKTVPAELMSQSRKAGDAEQMSQAMKAGDAEQMSQAMKAGDAEQTSQAAKASPAEQTAQSVKMPHTVAMVHAGQAIVYETSPQHLAQEAAGREYILGKFYEILTAGNLEVQNTAQLDVEEREQKDACISVRYQYGFWGAQEGQSRYLLIKREYPAPRAVCGAEAEAVSAEPEELTGAALSEHIVRKFGQGNLGLRTIIRAMAAWLGYKLKVGGQHEKV